MKLIPDVSKFVDKNKERSADPKGSVHAFELVITIILFLFMGRLADSTFDSSPVFTLVIGGIGFCGTFASAYYRYKATSEKLEKGKVWSEKKQRSQAPELVETPDELLVPKGYGKDD